MSSIPTLYKLPPEERAKRMNAYNFVRRHLEPPTDRCQKCGEVKKLEAHHIFGYDYGGIAIWVCRKCHFAMDRRWERRRRDSKGRFAVERKQRMKV
jgi:hypothetical protein